MPDSAIIKTTFLAADADTVWRYLTEKDKLAKWFHPSDADLCEGRDYVLGKPADDGSIVRTCWGSVLEATRPSKLVYSFTVEPLGGAMTTVTWLVEEVHGGTCLSLRHEGISQAAGEAALSLLRALDAGWDVHIGQLRKATG